MAAICLLGDDGTIAERWEIGAQPVAIGRDEAAEVVVKDGTLSRRHFQIWQEGENFLIKDLNSQNGTWVEGKLAQGLQLHHNDCILAGRTLFLFSLHPPSSAAARTGQPPQHDTAFLPALLAAERASRKAPSISTPREP